MSKRKPPDQRRRANTTKAEVHGRVLPAEGRSGRPPAPRVEDPCSCGICREAWSTLWSTPQATAWSGTDLYVASRWLKLYGEVVHGDPSASKLSELRQLEDSLVLTPKAMRREGWRVEESGGEASVTDVQTYRDLRAVDDEGA